MRRIRRFRGCERKLATTSKRAGVDPGDDGRSASVRWSTAVTSRQVVNCSSSRSIVAASTQCARSRYTTGCPCESWNTAPSNRSHSGRGDLVPGRGDFVLFFTSAVGLRRDRLLGHVQAPAGSGVGRPALLDRDPVTLGDLDPGAARGRRLHGA